MFRGHSHRATSRAAGSSRTAAAGWDRPPLYSVIQGEQARAATVSTNALACRASHFAPKAKRVISLFMAGTPSHLELFDDKPELAKWDGKRTFRFQGRDFRLTDVHGNVVTKDSTHPTR